MDYWRYVTVSFLASVIGSICGIGGGVMIKPTLDALGTMSIQIISFLSGATVFAMSGYSVFKNRAQKMQTNDVKQLRLLAIGAVIGGIVGKELFQFIASLFIEQNSVAVVQAALLIVLTIGTLIYTLKKKDIVTRKIENSFAILIIGIVLGFISSFLGIGGGPINLVVLYYFFSLDTKSAVRGSLYIIMFSQGASLISTVILSRVPEFEWILMILMVASGIVGAGVGHRINEKLSEEMVHTLFIMLMIGIVIINVFNIFKYM